MVDVTTWSSTQNSNSRCSRLSESSCGTVDTLVGFSPSPIYLSGKPRLARSIKKTQGTDLPRLLTMFLLLSLSSILWLQITAAMVVRGIPHNGECHREARVAAVRTPTAVKFVDGKTYVNKVSSQPIPIRTEFGRLTLPPSGPCRIRFYPFFVARVDRRHPWWYR